MKIFIVRHGETEANVQRVLQGHSDTPLSLAGKTQIHLLAERLKNEKIDQCFSSDLLRARQTAEIIAKSCGFNIQFTAELRERCYGEFEGKSVVEYEDALLKSTLNKLNFRPLSGENISDLEERIRRFCKSILQIKSDSSILLVGHSGTNKMLLKVLLEQDYQNFEQNNSCLNLIEVTTNSTPKSTFINCTKHLVAEGISYLGTYE